MVPTKAFLPVEVEVMEANFSLTFCWTACLIFWMFSSFIGVSGEEVGVGEAMLTARIGLLRVVSSKKRKR